MQFGLITDLHYADKPPAGSRHYRETPDKLAEAAEHFGKRGSQHSSLNWATSSTPPTVWMKELGYLKRINRDFSAICKDRHCVLGNHCVYTLTKQEFLEGVEQKKILLLV